ncbi:MAG: membrane-bound PQQ-dependent dehydrogenase, glucose/quinate/shikimate family, partial [Phenylobacterium sp.]|nr:membrane-bound PQQ-dependent dehydrogenase, glucose/quinate/shikimate family [Phenylobacterium sp.]
MVWIARAVGAVLGVIGLVLLVGGVWLVAIGGSPYYALAGAGLLAAGGLLIRDQVLGVAVYALVFLATVVWALWEVGLQGWPLLPRVVGPALLLLPVLAIVPLLTPSDMLRRTALFSGVGALALLLVGSVVVAVADRLPAPGSLTAAAGDMSEPSPLAAGADWPAYGGTYSARRFSPLAQITPENVGRLERAWVSHTGDLPSERAKNKYGAETTPLKVGDGLYLCSAKNILIALDAATGRERWRYDPGVSDDWIPYTAACRGVAYHGQPGADPSAVCSARIIEGTLDGRLIAVDARTGRPCPDFGRAGQVDIKQGMGAVSPGMVSITSPPVIVRDVIVTGHQVLDGQELNAPSGVIQGFDVITGAQRWAWDLGRPGQTAPATPDITYTRGTPNMWTIATGDDALGLVYLPMGNSAVDYWSRERSPEENAFSTALVALDVTTGSPAWRFQTVYKDVWDYDLGSQATLIDFPTPTGAVPALLLPSKQGDLYVLDRRTGRPLTRVEQRAVPQGGVEPEQRARTQPFSGYHTLAKPRLTEKDMWGMSPIDQMICRIQFRSAAYEGPYTPPTHDRRWIQYPGYNGGSDWGGVAVDPRRGVIVANYNDMPNYNRLIPRKDVEKRGWTPRSQARGGDLGGAEGAGDPQAGAPYGVQVNAGWRMPITNLLCKAPPYGGIRAIDLRTGRTLWDRPFGTARRNGPFGIPSNLPFEIGTPNNGGAVVTASGLVFIAA